jgi:hypothetical protein
MNMENPETKKGKANNPLLEDQIMGYAEDGQISCAGAMQIAAELGEPRWTVGRMLDQWGIHLGKCQLGLFGCVHPENRIVQAASTVSPEFETEIRKALQGECLPCEMAWRIAEERKISPIDVSAACECLQIRIKPCQFGTF